MPPNLTLIYYSFDFTKSARRAVIKGSQFCFQKAFLESGIHRACLPAHNPTQQTPGLQTQRAPSPVPTRPVRGVVVRRGAAPAPPSAHSGYLGFIFISLSFSLRGPQKAHTPPIESSTSQNKCTSNAFICTDTHKNFTRHHIITGRGEPPTPRIPVLGSGSKTKMKQDGRWARIARSHPLPAWTLPREASEPSCFYEIVSNSYKMSSCELFLVY